MDTFFEQIISVKKSSKAIAAIIGIWLLAILISAVAFLFLPIPSLTFLLIVGLFFAAFKLAGMFNIEYEYIITNGIMDVDKITNKGSRKRVLSFELSNVSRLEKFNPSLLNSAKPKDIIKACDSSDKNAYLMVSSQEGKGTYYLVFAPDERIKSAIVKFVPKFIANTAFN